MNEIMTGADTSVNPQKNVKSVKAETHVELDNWTNYDKPLPSSFARDRTLDDCSFRLAVYLFDLPSTWILRPSYIRKQLGWGKDKWDKASRGLRESGYMQLLPIRGEDGKIRGRKLRFSIHKNFPNTAKSIPINRKSEKPTFGENDQPKVGKTDSRKNRLITTKENNINNINTNNDYNYIPSPARPPSPTADVVVVSCEESFKAIMDRVGQWGVAPGFVRKLLSVEGAPYLWAAIEYTEKRATKNPGVYFANTCKKRWCEESVQKETPEAKAIRDAKRMEELNENHKAEWRKRMLDYDPDYFNKMPETSRKTLAENGWGPIDTLVDAG